MLSFEERFRQIRPGTEIPKPTAHAPFDVKGTGTRRGELALIYLIPNRKNPDRPYQKGITLTEFDAAYREMTRSGMFTKRWFDSNLPACAQEVPVTSLLLAGSSVS
jgi:hypothetical protein